METALLWFRQDLRLADNPALDALLDDGFQPIPVYIHDQTDEDWPLGAASAWWLHHSLSALDDSLLQRGSRLLLRQGDAQQQLVELIRATGAVSVYWNRCYEPAHVQRDTEIKQTLEALGIPVHSHNGALLREPWEIATKTGKPYRVFTPFWKTLLQEGSSRRQLTAPAELPALPSVAKTLGEPIEALALLPGIPWYQAFHKYWQPGETGAGNALQHFCDQHLSHYPEARDFPGHSATSRLSAHLHFGEISPVQAWDVINRHMAENRVQGAIVAGESWLRQLAWRDFSHHLLYHFPHTALEPLDTRFTRFPWRDNYTEMLTHWQRGTTGIPIVDAGMRELWVTGFMHNRVRMLAASFLTKNLLIPWQEGARWFWDTLVDADLANNTMGWQWTAGSGADASPYFRVFNPVLQGEKFDTQGDYVRRWVPELKRLPTRFIHQPWSAPAELLAQHGVTLGTDYPAPMVDLKLSRQQALEAWGQVKQPLE